jgi:hypothetical protein
LEVETINCSDKQIDSLASLSPTVLSWANGLSDGFKNKLLCAVGHARKQLGSFVGPSDKKIVLLVIRMDCECWFNDKNYKEIQELASTQASNDLEVVVRWPEKNEADH